MSDATPHHHQRVPVSPDRRDLDRTHVRTSSRRTEHTFAPRRTPVRTSQGTPVRTSSGTLVTARKRNKRNETNETHSRKFRCSATPNYPDSAKLFVTQNAVVLLRR